MAKSRSRGKARKASSAEPDPLELQQDETVVDRAESRVHLLGPGIVCDTEPRGHAMPQGRSPLEIVVDASEGFVPLWAKDVTLHWRFDETSMSRFRNPAAAKAEIRKLFGEALLAWGKAAPVTFTTDVDVWDFEVVMQPADNCSPSGCVLASAFFPDSGRHRLTLFPKMFEQPRKEQVETLIHEIGHVFGLRHFFAEVSETAWPSEVFGTHSKFSIMNYGSLSELTAADKSDLRRLYQLAWSGALTHINGTPIRLVKPYHSLAVASENIFSVSEIAASPRERSRRTYLG
jgi:hypothetical protein